MTRPSLGAAYLQQLGQRPHLLPEHLRRFRRRRPGPVPVPEQQPASAGNDERQGLQRSRGPAEGVGGADTQDPVGCPAPGRHVGFGELHLLVKAALPSNDPAAAECCGIGIHPGTAHLARGTADSIWSRDPADHPKQEFAPAAAHVGYTQSRTQIKTVHEQVSMPRRQRSVPAHPGVQRVGEIVSVHHHQLSSNPTPPSTGFDRRGMSTSWAECSYVNCRRAARLPARQRVDRVEVDKAIAFPEGPRGFVGAVAGGAVQGLGLDHTDSGRRQVTQEVAKQPGSVPAAAAGRVDGDPQDFRAGG